MKKIWIGKIIIALVLCLCFLTEQVYAAEPIKYKETKYSPPVKDARLGYSLGLDFDPSRNVRLLMSGYTKKTDNLSDPSWSTYVTYNSKGKKTIEELPRFIYNWNGVLKKNDYIYDFESDYEDKNELRMYNSEGKIIEKWRGNIRKKLGIKDKYVSSSNVKIVEVTGKYNVTLFYSVWLYKNGVGSYEKNICSYAVQINVKTGKFKKLYSFKFPVSEYDGKYIYGYKENEKKGTITFYRKSVKTRKTEKFTTKALKSVKAGKDYYYYPKYSFYKGKVMGIAPKGGVYYGSFSKGKFKKIGSISSCKNFKKYEIVDLAMKSKNEFYLAYSASWKKKNGSGDSYIDEPFVVKYSAK